MEKYLRYESSSIDWCETNYKKSIYIAEFWNSITSISFIFIPLILKYKYDESMNLKREYDFSRFTALFIGLTSFYFHSTLSLLGQILDEASLLILLIGCLWLFFKLNTFKVVISICILLPLLFFEPELNAYLLIIGGSISVYLIKKHSKLKLNYKQYKLASLLFILGIVSWILDKICFQNYFSFHALWHILTCLSMYNFVLSVINNKKI